MARQKSFLGDSSNFYLKCRDLMHAWKWENDFLLVKDEDRKTVGMKRTLSCMRCGTVRIDEFSLPDMEKIKSGYIYPENYRITGFKGHIPVSEIRKEIVTRIKRREW
jgi:hypothetical protein